MRFSTVKRFAIMTFFGLMPMLTGCVFSTKESQIETNALAEPPFPAGFYVRGDAGKESEAIKFERGPTPSRGLLLIEKSKTISVRFIKLDRSKFIMELSPPDTNEYQTYSYFLVEVDSVMNTVTGLSPDSKVSEVQLLLRKHGFNANKDEISPGTKHDMVAMFNGLLAIERSGTQILDRSIVYRRVSQDEWSVVNARLLKEEKARESLAAQETREREEQLSSVIRTVMNSIRGCAKYQVQRGDSAIRIAVAAGLSLKQLVEINPHIEMGPLAVNDQLNFKIACKGF